MSSRILKWGAAAGLLLVAAVPMAFGQAAAPQAATSADESAESNQATVIIVKGAPGAEEFVEPFAEWTARLKETAEKAKASVKVIGEEKVEGTFDRDRLKEILEAEPKSGPTEIYLILLGHGTFDGRAAKFNLVGPDVSAEDLADWLKPFDRPLAIVNAASASGPFISALSGKGRVVVTAAKSGNEINFTRFGAYFSKTLSDPEADLDKDGQTSLLEAYLMASRKVEEFYKTEGRLATEHALLDDNGDDMGTPADFFKGIRATKKAASGKSLDGNRAHQFHLIRSEWEQRLTPEQRAQRNELELAVIALRDRKEQFKDEDVYYARLEQELLKLASFYQAMEPEPEPEAKKPEPKESEKKAPAKAESEKAKGTEKPKETEGKPKPEKPAEKEPAKAEDSKETSKDQPEKTESPAASPAKPDSDEAPKEKPAEKKESVPEPKDDKVAK